MSRFLRAPVLAVLALPAAAGAVLSSCVLLAGAGAGYVVTQEVLPNEVHEAQVNDDVDRVWTVAKETFEILLDPKEEMRVTEQPRRLEGKVDGADVTIEVEAHDIDRTMIRVQAKKYLANDGHTAEDVMNRLLARLSK